MGWTVCTRTHTHSPKRKRERERERERIGRFDCFPLAPVQISYLPFATWPGYSTLTLGPTADICCRNVLSSRQKGEWDWARERERGGRRESWGLSIATALHTAGEVGFFVFFFPSPPPPPPLCLVFPPPGLFFSRGLTAFEGAAGCIAVCAKSVCKTCKAAHGALPLSFRRRGAFWMSTSSA